MEVIQRDNVFGRKIISSVIANTLPLISILPENKILQIMGNCIQDSLDNGDLIDNINENEYGVAVANISDFEVNSQLTNKMIMLVNSDKDIFTIVEAEDQFGNSQMLDYYNQLDDKDQFLSGELIICWDTLLDKYYHII